VTRKFERVRKQIADHLLQQPQIAMDGNSAGHDAQTQTLSLCVVGELLPQARQQVVQRQVGLVDDDRAGVDLINIEQDVEHAAHGLKGLIKARD
jgi:hypothetical protein